MNIANCRLMGLALRPQLPPLDVKSVIIIIIIIYVGLHPIGPIWVLVLKMHHTQKRHMSRAII